MNCSQRAQYTLRSRVGELAECSSLEAVVDLHVLFVYNTSPSCAAGEVELGAGVTYVGRIVTENVACFSFLVFSYDFSETAGGKKRFAEETILSKKWEVIWALGLPVLLAAQIC
jgi:hypothetical protein